MIKYRYIPFSTGKKVCNAELKALCELIQSVTKSSDKVWMACAALHRLRVIKTTSQIGRHLESWLCSCQQRSPIVQLGV